MVGMTGFEPAATRSQTECSTKLSYIPMATPTGFEPAISTVTGWHANRYTTEPCYFGAEGEI